MSSGDSISKLFGEVPTCKSSVLQSVGESANAEMVVVVEIHQEEPEPTLWSQSARDQTVDGFAISSETNSSFLVWGW